MHRPTLTQTLQSQQTPPALVHVIDTVAQACQRIGALVGQGALSGVLGSHGTHNVQGEMQQTLDVMANDVLLAASAATCLAAVASEEMDDVHPIAHSAKPPRGEGEYLLLFDPLDGSSNIAVNVSIGTIFSVLRAPQGNAKHDVKPGARHTLEQADFLQPGTEQVAAGYVIYGPQTQLVLTLGQGVSGFTLDQTDHTWRLTQAALRIPEQTQEFAINMSNMRHWEAPVQRYVQECLAGKTGPLGKDYNMRWIASMVADVHRVLTRGGVFLYPRDARPSAQSGKLRLLYEANPMSFLVEQAGGAAIDGMRRILELPPKALHQRTSVMLGSRQEIERLQAYHAATARLAALRHN